MGVEIERKFLVEHDGWRAAVIQVEHLRDGLVARFGGGKVRVRQAQGRAWIALKGPRAGLVRSEFEYEIPVADAEEILLTLCDGRIIEKARHCVHHAGHVWSVDVHAGELEGLILAEIELGAADEAFVLPSWAGREVTHDPAYQKGALLRLRREAADLASQG
jgi:CYTH domain-containing protein